MADMLASDEDLASLLQKDIDTATAVLTLEICTAVVQAACGGRRIVLVTDDTEEVWGGTESLLRLSQAPIVSITSVTYNGEELEEGTASGTWRRAKHGLWRDVGWVEVCGEPLPTNVVYTHGHDPNGSAKDRQATQLGRGIVLNLARGLFENPGGIAREQIDDYSVAFEKATAALDASPSAKALLRRQYGPKARMVSAI
jgi:hypothetical protein